MNLKAIRRGRWLATGTLSFVMLGLVGVASAVTFNQSGSVSRNNTIGQSFDVMSNSANTFCYLSRVFSAETDNGNTEYADCRIEIDGSSGNWVLIGELGQTGDADVACWSHCYNN
jgi:hypothetical protein